VPHPKNDMILVTLKKLYGEEAIAQYVSALAAEIKEMRYDADAIAVPVLTGALFFAADLLREAMWTGQIYPIIASSYNGETESSGKVVLYSQVPDVKDKDILIIDDILDKGNTLTYLGATFKDLGCSSCAAVTLFAKETPNEGMRTEFLEEYLSGPVVSGPTVTEFIVGYGMDVGGLYRASPAVYAWRTGEHGYIH